MIKKFNKINYGSYGNFSWGDDLEFKKINIFYGRNYSGKTTLSRILRSFELKKPHNDYPNTTFEIELENAKITQNDINKDILNLRVYNKDFVKDNLSFLIDDSRQEADIKAFSSIVVGERNKDIIKQIEDLKQERGFQGNEGNNEASGLYRELKELSNEKQQIQDKKNEESKKLDESLQNKAKEIKQDSNFVKQGTDYNKATIKKEIEKIKDEIEQCILQEQDYERYKNTIKDESKDNIDFSINFEIGQFSQILSKAKELVEKEITAKENIENDLRKWLIEGLNLHKNEQKCKFCDSLLNNERLKWLIENVKDDSEEKKRFENEIKEWLEEFEKSKNNIESIPLPKDEQFYSQNINKFIELKKALLGNQQKYSKELEKIKNQILSKQDNIFEKMQLDSTIYDYSQDIKDVLEEIQRICDANNEKTKTLDNEKEQAREKLRLDEVARFVKDIDYFQKEKENQELCKKESTIASDIKSKQDEINKFDNQIKDLEFSLNDEKAGADKANKYLKCYGNNQLEFQVIENKKGEFKILRAGLEAKNLSEGECSLLAFCYFIAKLPNDKDLKPIIFIDDPISSLDSNHIFFIFSLIESQIAKPKNFEQLFISTHNLEFLRYLKSLSGFDQKKQEGMFLIEKQGQESTIKKMPKHLGRYITEFNYLFEKILRCAECNVDDIDYSIGNDMRKFLDSYLFFKYPNTDRLINKYEKFFKDDKEATLVNRVVNEFSHLEENVTRATMPMDCQELQEVAKIIIERLKIEDKEQFQALKESIAQ